MSESLFPFEMPEFLGFVFEVPKEPEQHIVYPPTRGRVAEEGLAAVIAVIARASEMVLPLRASALKEIKTASKRKFAAASSILGRRPKANIARERADAKISHSTATSMKVKSGQAGVRDYESDATLAVHAVASSLHNPIAASRMNGRKTGSSLEGSKSRAKMY